MVTTLLSGIVYDPQIDGKALTFGVSGRLYRSNLLMFDRETDSLWSQLLQQAITGPLTGKKLVMLPAVHTTWGSSVITDSILTRNIAKAAHLCSVRAKAPRRRRATSYGPWSVFWESNSTAGRRRIHSPSSRSCRLRLRTVSERPRFIFISTEKPKPVSLLTARARLCPQWCCCGSPGKI